MKWGGSWHLSAQTNLQVRTDKINSDAGFVVRAVQNVTNQLRLNAGDKPH